jgi:hypothetical protein
MRIPSSYHTHSPAEQWFFFTIFRSPPGSVYRHSCQGSFVAATFGLYEVYRRSGLEKDVSSGRRNQRNKPNEPEIALPKISLSGSISIDSSTERVQFPDELDICYPEIMIVH